MKARILAWLEKFNAMEIRMRLMISFALAMTIAFVFDFVWFTPTAKQQSKLEIQIGQFDKQIEETLKSQQALNKSIVDQRHHPKRKQLEQITQQISELRSALEEKTFNLVTPEEMNQVLREIIKRSDKLTLLSLSQQPPVAIFEEDPNSVKSEQDQQIQLYRHSVNIVLSGNFQNTQEFILALENMPKKVAFDQFRFSVDEYPRSEIRLSLSTLSFDRSWIGG